MGHQRVLDLSRIDVVPTGDDHVAGSVDQVQVAALVESPDIAGTKPAVAWLGRRVQIGRVEVPGMNERRADGYLAELSGGNLFACVVEQSYFGVDRGLAARAERRVVTE